MVLFAKSEILDRQKVIVEITKVGKHNFKLIA